MGGNGMFIRRKRSGGWEGTDCLYEGNGAEDRRERIVYTKASARRMGGDGSFVQGGRKKVYRLSENTL